MNSDAVLGFYERESRNIYPQLLSFIIFVRGKPTGLHTEFWIIYEYLIQIFLSAVLPESFRLKKSTVYLSRMFMRY